MATPDTATTAEVVAWVNRNAMPIGSTVPGEAPGDLPELPRVLDGVRVVGMGEVTHGTAEFYRLRHRLLRRLVTEMGFTILAVEGGHSAARVIDDHVTKGVGEHGTAGPAVRRSSPTCAASPRRDCPRSRRHSTR